MKIKKTVTMLSMMCCLHAHAAEDIQAALAACRALDAADDRLSCYDQLADWQPDEVPQLEKPAAQAAESAAIVPASATDAEFGRSADKPKAPNSITARVHDIQTRAYGSLVFELDNGQVWQQVDSKRTTIRKTDEVTIETALSGSFMMRKSSGGSSIRVRRIDG